ncbi:MAG: leucine-rich repeat domain-containing protein [Gammaproteobacteria bacterium]|nr:leucine-rich repeat domain-containing protein [Gammaproteobacteria bacterium]
MDERKGILTATLMDGTGYAVSKTFPDAAFIARDNDVPVVSIAAGEAATEGGTAEFAITAAPVPAADLEVSVSVTQGPDDDFLPDAPPTSVTIAAAATEATLSVELPDDSADEPDGVVTATILAHPDSYEVATASASLTVHDNDQPPLTAAFHDVPAEHWGKGFEFGFLLEFSEDLARELSSATLRDHALAATNATVTRAARVVKGENRRWMITVVPESGADVTVTLAATTDCSTAGALCTEDGRPLSGSVSATVAAAPPLKAEFVDMPKSHDGTGVFEFELRFSEDFPGRLPYTLLRDEAFRVERGAVRKAGRVDQDQNQRWTIAVRPDSHEDVTVELPAVTDCDAPGAVCTEAGRPLSNTVTATVEGPPPLTAEFVGMPESHDGVGTFEFELRFSEDFPGRLPPRLLRDEAFEVTHGTVQRARRVEQEQNRRWTIAVQPDSHEDVTVELPAATDCDAVGAVCTEAGRPLSNTTTATVAGPQASAQVDGSVLTLAWETRRDGFALPSGKDFAVRVDGGLRAVASTSLWMRGVVLGLAEPVRPHQAVAVDYLGSAMHPLRDGAGDAEPAWRDLPAVNVTGVASAEGPAVRATAANRPPVTDDVSASFAGLELGDTGLAVAGIGTDVRRLDLSRNGLADIATLARLRALESLDLSDNDIIDVSALRGLTALRRLDLGGNDIVEVWPLADLPDLEVLVLDGNRVADVGALTHMARLENLGLARNAVEDISPLADLRSLRRLDLGWNPVRDLSPVGDLQRLVWLRLPDAGGDAPTHRLVLLRWLLAPDTPGTCLGCAVLRND